ncbi:MAG TPA: hypothetical protein VMR00_21240 [Streptosporangiaceae bacterium]|jgi:hypothetical protein|nr:hypothetical protein [Streptosporangiaceae bacterium]
MMNFIPPRLRKPALIGIAGAVFSVAWVVRGGPLWWVSIMAGVATVIRVVALWALGGRDTDEGALAGSRADERQRMVGLRSRAVAGSAAAVTAFLGLSVTIATKSPAWWAFLVMMAVIFFAYLFGLSDFGADTDSPADGESAHYAARSPASW